MMMGKMPVPVALTIRERKQFAARMRKLRKALGITQLQAAKFMRISLKTVQNVEVMRHGPSSDVFLAFRKFEKQVRGEAGYGSLKRVPR
jgi:DNA-binding XRE family transcriptional regulator